MTASRVERVVGVDAVPDAVLRCSSLPGVDYADVFTLHAVERATPERWARAMFGDVPDLAETVIWRGLLGLRLVPRRSADVVAGWRIGGQGDGWIRLEASSWFLTGNLVVRTSGDRVSLGTLVRYDRRLGRVVWPPLSVVHRRLAPGLLRDADALLGKARSRT